MKKYIYYLVTMFAIGSLLLFPSCSKDDPAPVVDLAISIGSELVNPLFGNSDIEEVRVVVYYSVNGQQKSNERIFNVQSSSGCGGHTLRLNTPVLFDIRTNDIVETYLKIYYNFKNANGWVLIDNLSNNERLYMRHQLKVIGTKVPDKMFIVSTNNDVTSNCFINWSVGDFSGILKGETINAANKSSNCF